MEPPSPSPDLRHATDRLSAAVPEASLPDALARIGRRDGWFFSVPMWAVRLKVDEAVRGCRYSDRTISLVPGARAGFWEVEATSSTSVRFRALAKTPGTVWLDYAWRPSAEGVRVEQTFWFEPRGLLGKTYWMALKPIHGVVYAATLRALVGAAERG